MHIRAKLYPYPVLASFNNDYLDSSFDIEVEEIITEKEITFKFTPKLDNEELANVIRSNDASFVVHIECSFTCFRKLVEVPFEGKTITISANKVEEVMHLCPFIVAERDIYDYKNSKFNAEYEGVSFELDKGSIMAIGFEKVIRIEKEDDDLANVPSIFSVTEIIDPKVTDIVIDYSGDKIGLRLPSPVYRKFVTQNSNNPNAQPVLHAMLIIPALIKCLEEVKHSGEDYYLYEERRWFRSILKAAKKLNIDISEENICNIDTFDVAQKIMKNTTANGIINLNKVAIEGGSSNED